MKKNIIMIFSVLLITSMFLSIAYVKFFGKEDLVAEELSHKKIKQQLHINIGADPLNLHPGLASDYASETVIYQIFEGLTRKDLWGQTVNAAAKVIKISDDQKTYWFTLRDAKWSNGDKVTAKDFEYAWKWILNPINKSKKANQLYIIEGAKAYHEGKGNAENVGVRALNDKTLEVKLVEPMSDFPQLVSSDTFFPINRKVAQENSDWASSSGIDFISNGPFVLKTWNQNSSIELIKNERYWDVDSVKLTSILMDMESNPITKLSKYKNGDFNWGGIATKEIFDKDDKELLDEEVFKSQSVLASYFINLNTTTEPFNNKNIRKAFALAINRQQLTEDSPNKGDIPALSMIPTWLLKENKKGYFKDNDFNLANEYLLKGLQELGYQNISQLPSLTMYILKSENDEKIAESIREMWSEKLGININVKKMEWGEYNGNIRNSNYDLALVNEISDFSDPQYFPETFLDSEANVEGWEREKYKSLVKDLKAERDGDNRKQLILKAESVLIEEMPSVPVFFYTFEYLKEKELTYLSLSNTGHYQFKWAYFESIDIEGEQ